MYINSIMYRENAMWKQGQEVLEIKEQKLNKGPLTPNHTNCRQWKQVSEHDLKQGPSTPKNMSKQTLL